jgi:hypothetical protein
VTSPSATKHKSVDVEFRDGEYVVGRGTQRVIWFVRQDKSWRGALHCPGASAAEVDSGPGTVWESVITVPLAPGSQVMKVTVSPLAEQPRSALDYLLAPRLRPPKKTVRTCFVVDSRGALVRKNASA